MDKIEVGTLCAECAEYIGKPIGHPRLCEICMTEDNTYVKPYNSYNLMSDQTCSIDIDIE